MEFLPAVELKRSISAMGIFDGYGSTFGGDPDSHGDVIAPGAFANSLKEHASRNTRPALLWAHDRSEPIGAWSLAEGRRVWPRGVRQADTGNEAS
ncbi:HK97 family phage prohead protease [Rhizobium sp. AN63]|uniref:HK97 family phage prohead protease n=2 Tax=Rhizobium TaxID=379 RepID=UPI0035A169A5